MLRSGSSWSAIQDAVGCSRATIAKIAKRWARQPSASPPHSQRRPPAAIRQLAATSREPSSVRAVDLARTCRGPSRHAILAPNARIGRNRDIRATSAAIADLERVAVAGAKAGSIGGGSGASQLLEPRDTSRPSAYAADGAKFGAQQ